jgi:hypothetical protein
VAGQAHLPGLQPRRLGWPGQRLGRPVRRRMVHGFRLAVQADLHSRIVRAWGIVPAAVNERDVAEDLLQTGPPPRDLPAGKGFSFSGAAFAATQAARGTAALIPPAKGQRLAMPPLLRKSSPSDATASKPPSARSPAEWTWPAAAPAPSGARLPAPERPHPDHIPGRPVGCAVSCSGSNISSGSPGAATADAAIRRAARKAVTSGDW